METFKIETIGTPPIPVRDMVVNRYNGKVADSNRFKELDNDIEFVVVDLALAHGNLNKHSKEAWLSPRNNDGSWNIRIAF